MGNTGVLQTPVTGSVPVSSTTFRVSREYDGQMRRLFATNCIVCGTKFWAPRKAGQRCCGAKCRGQNQRSRVTVTCAQCSKELSITPKRIERSRSGLIFCDRLCKEKAQRAEGIREIQPCHYGDGGTEYRKRALREYGSRCKNCGYDEHEEMLDVNHKDGNRKNGKIENLEVLCVWCHAWETRMVQRKTYRPRPKPELQSVQ